ncbi:hypothetical protein CEY04_06450 [Achromobacter sp. HZ28]|nr:hypothetical protein CEY05_06460 [Achromobacter sp. HZ34]OWT81509.1 hypothetical protein CEY04_06450 [Achromobacter sp. HZ28]
MLKEVELAYDNAKEGRWDRVMAGWEQFPVLARRCSRYRKPSSGWTFLHQAAYFGDEAASRLLIRWGARIGHVAGIAADTGGNGGSGNSCASQTPADVAEERGHAALASLLRAANLDDRKLYAAPTDDDLLPSSCHWDEAAERRAAEPMLVSYGGGIVKIPKGSRHFVDAFDRTLIGWHGTFDPPLDMGGYPAVGIR